MLSSSIPFDPEIFGSVTPDTSGLGHPIGYHGHYPHQYTLPASFRSQNDSLEPSIPNSTFLAHELGVPRLNDIHKWLWLVGRPMPPRPLHYQQVLGREIVITERMDLHLVWNRNRILIKPIPRFLLDYTFWQDHLLCKPDCVCTLTASDCKDSYTSTSLPECTERQLYKCAAGFLLSYTGLISHESDYHIAHSDPLHLLPSSITWPQWILLVQNLLTRCNNPETINPRYLYGELRLSRLNAIYRLTRRNVIRGYVSGYREYSEFFRASFTRIFAVFAYVTVVLTAMQVALATMELGDDVRMQRASYGFALFAILGPLAVGFVVLGFVAAAFVCHLCATLRFREKRKEAFEEMAKGGIGVWI